MNKTTLSAYPSVSWRNGNKDSKIHYRGRNNYTLCGKRIPSRGIGEGDSADMCERCLKIAGGNQGV